MNFNLVPTDINENEKTRNSIGGYPVVPEGYDWPLCLKTNSKMVLFLQVDLPHEMGVGSDSHLSLFMSPEINDIPSFDYIPAGSRLPAQFWEKREQHFKAYFFNGEGTTFHESDQYLKYQKLEKQELNSSRHIRIGGSPDWIQEPELPVGPNGENFQFVMQIPENYRFPQKPNAPEQPDSFSSTDYCLFLGNQIYIFVSKEIENPEAVWIVVQN